MGFEIVGMMRVKNEARWIAESINSLLAVCEHVFVFDDHSTDGTELLAGRLPRTTVMKSTFEGVDEARDKNELLKRVVQTSDPEWILHIDGDEVLEAGRGVTDIRDAMKQDYDAYSLQVLYLWDRPDQIRTDGIYSSFFRPSLFRARGSINRFKQTKYGNGANFHCSNVPADRLDEYAKCRARLKHYGYMEREQRIKKYRWYNSIDPGNVFEDGYRHVVQGDLPEIPAEAVLRHAGPLRLTQYGL